MMLFLFFRSSSRASATKTKAQSFTDLVHGAKNKGGYDKAKQLWGLQDPPLAHGDHGMFGRVPFDKMGRT